MQRTKPLKQYAHLPAELAEALTIIRKAVYGPCALMNDRHTPLTTQHYLALAAIAEDVEDDDYSYFHAASKLHGEWEQYVSLCVATFEDQTPNYPLCDVNTFEQLLSLKDSWEYKTTMNRIKLEKQFGMLYDIYRIAKLKANLHKREVEFEFNGLTVVVSEHSSKDNLDKVTTAVQQNYTGEVMLMSKQYIIQRNGLHFAGEFHGAFVWCHHITRGVIYNSYEEAREEALRLNLTGVEVILYS